MKDVAIIIPYFETKVNKILLPFAISSALEFATLNSPLTFEFFLVNDSPQFKVPKDVIKDFTYIKNNKNMGRTFSIEKAASTSTARYMIVLDPDDKLISRRNDQFIELITKSIHKQIIKMSCLKDSPKKWGSKVITKNALYNWTTIYPLTKSFKQFESDLKITRYSDVLIAFLSSGPWTEIVKLTRPIYNFGHNSDSDSRGAYDLDFDNTLNVIEQIHLVRKVHQLYSRTFTNTFKSVINDYFWRIAFNSTENDANTSDLLNQYLEFLKAFGIKGMFRMNTKPLIWTWFISKYLVVKIRKFINVWGD